ncbi:MAG: hypothetical protein KY453_12520 [Gemmatimonadetes bacterium]|nr:hypothetical protein [Gemmatimonadota bacterium]
MPDGGSADGLRRRDEILQMMYWLRGEGLLDEVAPHDLLRFLKPAGESVPAPEVERDLQGLAVAGMVELSATGRYRLTARGVAEGGRRFADAFEGMTRQGHGACSDPDCECHVLGPEACVHGARVP